MGYMELVKSYSNQMRVVEAPASGGGLSQNGKFSYGYSSSAGKRKSMEDFFETRIDTVDGIDGEIVGLFGVFDGHGGAKAAEYVKRHLFSNLITHPKFISDTKSAITDAYNHTDSELLKSDTKDAGSTASTAILVGDRLLVANVGDSRAVICRGGNAFAVSRDHKPDQSDERERIENAGGFVMWAGTWRVGGVLAVSRAFGDRLLKQYVVADPEIQEEKIDDSLEFLILASDGLWDVFSNEEAVAVVKEVQDPEESSKKLVGEAIRRGSADNITCVVVRFLESNTADSPSSTHASSSKEPNQGPVRNDADHKISAKETNQDHNAVHSNVDSNTKKENLNQKPITASDNSSHSSSSQKPIANTAAERNVSSKQSGSAVEKNQRPMGSSSEHKSSAKQPSQGQTTVHNNLDHKISAKETKPDQKPITAREVNSSHISSTQKPVAISASERSVPSEQRCSAGEKNQMPVSVRSTSEPKSSTKAPDQGQVTLDSNLDSSVAKQKQKIATHNLSSEKKHLADEKSQMPNAVHSDSVPKNSAKTPDERQIKVENDLDCTIVNKKQLNAAMHAVSSEHSRSTEEKNRKPTSVRNESATNKASTIPSNNNYNAH